MKRLLSLVIVALHASIAIAAIAAPKAPAPPKPPAAPAPVPHAAAGDVKNMNGDVVIEKGKTVHDATAVNGSVTVFGHVTGDATAVNGNVRLRPGSTVDGKATAVNGRVTQDPGAVLGNKLSEVNTETGRIETEVCNGTIIENGRVAAMGRMGRGDHRIGNDVVVEKGETVNEATAIQGDVIVKGHVKGDVTAVLGNVYVRSGGKVDGDAVAVAGKVIRTGTGDIGGDVTSLDLGIPRHAWWSLPGGAWWTSPSKLGGWWFYAAYMGGLMILSALLSLVVIALFPQRMSTIADGVIARPGWSLLYGVLLAILVLPVAVLLAITCIGIPLIAVQAVLVIMLVVAGAAGMKLAIGQKIGETAGQPIRSLLLAGVLGSFVMSLLHLVPFIGGVVVYTLLTVGIGAALMTGFGARPDWLPSRMDRSSRPTGVEAVSSGAGPYVPPPPTPPAGPTEG